MDFLKTEIAKKNWVEKNRYKDEDQLGTFERIAKVLASNETDSDKWYEIFLNTLIKFKDHNPIGIKCSPGGRITTNIGTDYYNATLINCFINGPVKNANIHYIRENEFIKNDINIITPNNPDDLINIFLTIMEQAKTLASEGGYGINFDFIRPRGSLINGTGVRHPGIVSFMEVWDKVAECVVKGDNDGYRDILKNYTTQEERDLFFGDIEKITRKGAMMGCLSIWHPDIEEFIRSKQTSGKLTKFNISVGISDEFMKCVQNDEMWELKWDNKVVKRVKASELYDLIMESNYKRAEPGVLFLDTMNKHNPVAYLGKNNCVNPCGEIPGNPITTTVCLLGSVNLPMYVEFDSNNIPYFNWDMYKNDIIIFTRMLDNVCDLTEVPLPSYKYSVHNLRQFGMGINGLGSMLLMLGIPYNSTKALIMIEKLVDIKENLTLQSSAHLANEKGVFPLYDYDKYSQTEYFKMNILWDDTKKLIKQYGVRNATTTTNPPLGNSSILCDYVSNGIEPIFELESVRKIICKFPDGMNINNVKNILTMYTKQDYSYWEGVYNGKKYYYEPHNRGLCEIHILRDYGFQWLIDNKIKYSDDVYTTTSNLKIEDHLNVQEIVQKYCNQSVSKTVNISHDYPFEEYKKLYMNGWKRGLVGLTTYRDGSMESVIEKLNDEHTKYEIISEGVKLPSEFINGNTKTIKREGIKFYIHFSYLPTDIELKYPIAMWITTNTKHDVKMVNKACKNLISLAINCGVSKNIVEDAWDKCLGNSASSRFARMVSLCLRHNIPRQDILVALNYIDGDNISTLLAAVRKFIAETITNGTIIKGIKCPTCGGDNLMMQSGCFVCECGFSGCGA